ncbi:MAG: very short patch repair endonuclease [Patescibacteria group bacterium]|jgi:DNA mismatch endonuclease (patch repair protein)
MTDTLNKEQRRKCMQNIKSKETSPEIKVRKLLWGNGYKGYRKYSNLPGKPDIVFTKKKIVIFVNGCFWHKCNLCYKIPKSNLEYWKNKINNNLKRDKLNETKLKSLGWHVIKIWEHETKKDTETLENKLIKMIS